jgi:glycosyltransferase 2 family protein
VQRSNVVLVLKICVSITLLYVFFRAVAWEQVLRSLTQAQPLWFLASLAAGFGQLAVSAWRWQMLLRASRIQSPSMPALVRYYVISVFFNNLAPANLAGDAVRVGTLINRGESGVAAASTVILERILNLAMAGVLCIWAITVLPPTVAVSLGLGNLWLLMVAAAGCLVVVAILWRHPPKILAEVKIELQKMNYAIVEKPERLIVVILVSLLIHFVTMMVTYCNAQAVGLYIPLDVHMAVYSVAGLAIAIPISIQGIGVREGVYVGLFRLFGVVDEAVIAALALNYLTLLFFSAIGGILFWLRSPKPVSQT